MPTSPSSSAQAAREALAARLRDLRLDAGLTGRELASRVGWSTAKVSRVENARTLPSDADVRAWCQACGAEEQSVDLIAASRSADSMYVEWRRKQRTGLHRLQEAAVPLFERTRRFRCYCSNVVPGLIQTDAYATGLLSAITEFRRIPNDVTAAVEARMARSHVIREGDHQFALLVEEDVLYHGFGSDDTMVGQLAYLLTIMSLPSVSLGVIPRTTPRQMWPIETFMVFDEKQVSIELLSADVTLTVPSEVTLYVRAFAELADMAVYGPQARALITEAINSLG
jgi:transcriptional regulator with XRE-family HTH domain